MYHVRMKRRFHTLDVFTATPLAGNPLAVVLDTAGLDTARMQAIAREFNLSETVFVFDTNDPVNTARLRIFTPAQELPFAGHPTIGAAILIASLRAPDMAGRELQIVLEETVGPVCCTVRLAHEGAAHASFVVPRLPTQIGESGSRETLAAALSLTPRDVGFDNHQPGVWSAGTPFCFIPVANLDAMARAAPTPALAACVGEGRGAFLYTRETVDPAHSIHARMFGAGVGIAEDPATGSAAAAFAGVAARWERPEDGQHELIIEQGFEMGRPSLIFLGLDIEHGALVGATIGGRAVRISEGTIEV
jgi:trans-2,3-dihydro-3-hydroxyanthranilate isomerase